MQNVVTILNQFELFGKSHLLILFSIPLSAFFLGWVVRRNPNLARLVCFSLAYMIMINELAGYGYKLFQGWLLFPEGLPLHLCDITLWLTVLAAFTLKSWSYEPAYYFGIGGTTMAILTPDLWVSFPSYPAIQFFLAHGMVVVTILTITLGKIMKPSPGSVWRVIIFLNVYAIVVGLFNFFFDTNYLYICQKPASVSILDYFGPWPLYLFVTEVFAVLLFGLLWLPFRRSHQMRSA